MSLKAKVEALIYAAEDPITLEQIALLLKDVVLADLASAKENAAIEQADSAAEAAESAAATTATASQESELLPELGPESAGLFSPEPGPLMPEEVASVDSAQPEDAEVNTAFESTSAVDPDPEQSAHKEIQTEGRLEGPADETCEEGTAQEPVTASSVPDAEPAPAESASVAAPETTSRKRQPKKTDQEIAEDKAVRTRVREVLLSLITDYADEDRGMEIRQVAGGFRMATKPEHHDVVRAFAKSLKPPIRLSLAALETLAVIAYKQPVTAPEIADVRGVESASVLGTLLDRKLIITAGRKQVIGRPMQYKTSKDFLMRFGLNDVNELPSMEEFSQLASDGTIEIAPAEPQESLSLFEPEAESPKPSAAEDATPDAENIVPNHPAPASQAHEPNAAEAADSQPASEDESSNVPEAEHPIGR